MARFTSTDSLPHCSVVHEDTNLQPFFVLHKGSFRKCERKLAGKNRRLDLSPILPKNGENVNARRSEECRVQQHEQLRREAFEFVWSKIESTIKDVLMNTNVCVFDEVHCWVRGSFDALKSSGVPTFAQATQAYPFVTDAISRKLFTGLVLTKNMEFVDDLLTFKELGLYLKYHGCHVANLSSLDFSAKNGIGGCLRSLLRQFLLVTVDAADISILASWYYEQGSYTSPLVVIIDDMERCNRHVLSDFILMLSEWVLKLPIVVIMGVATNLDAVGSVLHTNALLRLSARKFILGSPAEKMGAIVEAVLVKQYSGFFIGYRVALFMRNYFLRQDGTLSSFIRALKIACALHFSTEPLSFLCKWLTAEGGIQALLSEDSGPLSEEICKIAYSLPSYARCKLAEQNVEDLVHGLSELERVQKCWSAVVLCLYEAGKRDKVQLLDLFCEALDSQLYNVISSNDHLGCRNDISTFDMHQPYSSLRKDGPIWKIVCKLRDLPATLLCKLLNSWEKHTKDIPEICNEVKKLQTALNEEGTNSKQGRTDTSNGHACQTNFSKDLETVNQKVAAILECMIRDYLQPIECVPFHEILCYKNVDKLQSAMIGDPRKSIQADLLEFRKILQCSCCSRSDNILLPSMPDASILYTLSQEHGDLINLHDWYQSYKLTILNPTCTKGKNKAKHSPLSKKRKTANELESEASIQARFCRAVTELQITGLLRMPSKRRPDFVQRVAFGL